MIYRDGGYLLTFEEVGMGSRAGFSLDEIDFDRGPFFVYLREKGFRLEKDPKVV